jgi:hypothetical protein
MTFLCFYRKIHNSSNALSKTVWATSTEKANNQIAAHAQSSTVASVTNPYMMVTARYKTIQWSEISTTKNVPNAKCGYKKLMDVITLTASVDASFATGVATNSIETLAVTGMYGNVMWRLEKFLNQLLSRNHKLPNVTFTLFKNIYFFCPNWFSKPFSAFFSRWSTRL